MADPYDTPGYRYSVNEFPGDGTTTDWNIQFAGHYPGYISINHVRASVTDGGGMETPLILSRSNFIQPTLLRIEPAVATGRVLRVWRVTPKDAPIVNYNDGAILTEQNLDTSFHQAVYVSAEMVDQVADSLKDAAEFSAGVIKRLVNVENTANGARDTANKARDTSNTSLASAAAAVRTANDALARTETAATAANLATRAANAADTAASVATAAANSANKAATDSLATAKAAESTATGIDAKATQALRYSTDARRSAETALSTAYLRRGALPTNTTHNLNNWGVLNIGIWYQGSSDSATPAQNYPIAAAGILEVLPGPSDSGGHIVQRYTLYLDGNTYVRSKTAADSWSAWEHFDTVRARDSVLTNYVTNTALRPALANYALKDNLEWLSRPLCEPFPLWDHINGCPIPPTNNPNFRFIKLTASDSYNTGVLTNESVVGTAPMVQATAQISLIGSPVNGATVHLINTEKRFLRAGVSGTVQDDALQNINASILFRYGVFGAGPTGAFNMENTGNSVELPDQGNYFVQRLQFDASRVARTDNETRGKNIQATYYMRIK